MAFRTVFLAANLPLLFGSLLWRGNVPGDGNEFKKGLTLLGLKPGPLGYFNSAYMAFTRAEADKFPNLVSWRSKMTRIKNNITSASIAPVRSKISTFKKSKSFPFTTLSGSCESTIGGFERLCSICPAITDLGPDKLPRYINEVLCGNETYCGVGGNVFGLCQNSTVTQSFLMKVGSTWEVYSQEIKVCCECALFFS